MKRCVLTLMAFCWSTGASAGWIDLWQRADQQAMDLMKSGQPEAAADVFSDSQWRGIARFQAGDPEGAVQAFTQLNSSSALYNGATALAHAGKLQQSLAMFNQLLEREPDHADGQANRDWVLQQLQEQQEQQNGQGDSTEGENGEQQAGEQNQQQNAGANSQEGEGGQSAGAPNEDGRQMSNNANNDAARGSSAGAESLASALQEQAAAEVTESQQNPADSQSTESTAAPAQLAEQRMDESQQATEQQLQRIPDDPAGLLRNKLYISHQSRHSELRRAEEPW